jgi:hypothetical protein
LGVDGGPGTDDLCRPLLQHPDVLGPQPVPAPAKGPDDEGSDAGGVAPPGAPREEGGAGEAGVTAAVELLIWLTAPDQDIARIHARVERVETRGGTRSGTGSSRLVTEAVESLLEPLRGLGGEANAAEAKVEVRCAPSARR